MRNYVAAAQHLAAAQQEGLCRHIGVTNFDVPRLKEMLDAGVRIVSNQARKAAGLPTAALPVLITALGCGARMCTVPVTCQGDLQRMPIALAHVA